VVGGDVFGAVSGFFLSGAGVTTDFFSPPFGVALHPKYICNLSALHGFAEI
jgi:hypothetical protein